MNLRFINILWLLPFSLLTGCALTMSLSDFEAMSAAERATLVCQRQSQVRHHQSEINRYQFLISSARQAISQGHRTDKQCERREIETGGITSCRTINTNRGQEVICEEKKEYETKRSCRDVRIPVDVALEQSNISAWSAELGQAQSRHDQIHRACFNDVVTLNAAEAYRRY